MNNVVLRLAYDGTDFSGWQRQNGIRSVQGEIEKALEKIHKHPVNLYGSGRTDSGVHAAGQAANFRSDIAGMDASRFVPALNSLLPRDIRILKAEAAPDDFHARFSAKSRAYRYFFICGREVMPYENRYALRMRRCPDIALLNSYCAFLSGETDCSVFAAAGDKSKSKTRYIFSAGFVMERDKLVFEIRANAFLWKMVRSIAGTLLHCEEKKMPVSAFPGLLRSSDRSRAGPTLPPNGLFLWNIGY